MLQTESTNQRNLDSSLELLGEKLHQYFSGKQPQVNCQLVRRTGDGYSLSILLSWHDDHGPKTLQLYAQRCTRSAGRFEVVCPELFDDALKHQMITMDNLSESQLITMTKVWIFSGAYRKICA